MGQANARLRRGDLSAATPLRDAATVIVVRDPATAPAVLMGQRGSGAAFMPDKFVFPGGAVDTDDEAVLLAAPVAPGCAARLALDCPRPSPDALAAAAIRELWEETGLILGRPGPIPEAPPGWLDFAETGFRPDASALSFFFRAVTPPGRPRRFDARFFLLDAGRLATPPEELAAGTAELSHLAWVPLADCRALNLAFITRVVLAELARHLPSTGAPAAVPMVRNDDIRTGVTWLRA